MTAQEKEYLGVALVLLALGAWGGIEVWRHAAPATPAATVAPHATPAVNQPVIAPPAPALAQVETVAVQVKAGTVKVYAPKAKARVSLPPALAADDREQVAAATELPADDHPREVVSVLNTDTGETQLVVTRKPLPWLAVDTHGEAGVYVGEGAAGPTVRAEVRQGLIDVKAVRVEAIASVDAPLSGPPSAFVGVGAAYRW